MLTAVSTVYDYHTTAWKNLNGRKHEALIPLTGISAVFSEHTQNNGLLIAALPDILSTPVSLAWCEGERLGLQRLEIRSST